MKRWLFVLGRQPSLGLAELLSVLALERVRYEARLFTSNTILVTSSSEQDLSKWLSRLGGTVKIGVVDELMPRSGDSRSSLAELLKPDMTVSRYSKHSKGRWTFGVSLYAGVADATLARSVHDFGLDIKRYLKSRKRSARFVEPRGASLALSSVVVRGNGLLDSNGTELLIALSQHEVLRAHTLAVQDFASYSNRDYGRPERNPKAGSLPPKLAQIMLNLARQPKGALIVDPFCGIGTVLQEALLMGYQVVGSDSASDQVERTRKNLMWLSSNYHTGQAQLQIAKAQEVLYPKATVAAFVTEGLLGPPQTRPFSRTEAAHTAQSILVLWRQVLIHQRDALKPEGRFVLVLPVLKVARTPQYNEPVRVALLDELENLGYRLQAPLPPLFAKQVELSSRGTLIYERPDQVVAREILILSKLH
ncbi:MAG: DNA methyltransferase [Parcubacteria group bacterium]